MDEKPPPHHDDGVGIKGAIGRAVLRKVPEHMGAIGAAQRAAVEGCQR